MRRSEEEHEKEKRKAQYNLETYLFMPTICWVALFEGREKEKKREKESEKVNNSRVRKTKLRRNEEKT